MADAVGTESPTTLAAIAADIDRLLATPATDAELTELLDAMGSDADPSPATAREWLAAVRGLLASPPLISPKKSDPCGRSRT
jgi:hypothetical protein